ncbi:MAG: hypothetical protein ACKOX6_00090, partial [Bdellovibrio sp.]
FFLPQPSIASFYMMRKILITLLLLSVAGCSFSKKSAEEKAAEIANAKSRASVDSVIGDQRYTIVEKLETAILKQDKDLFSSLLAQASPQLLNKIKPGKTLGERAIDTGDLFFLRGLIQAGMSPFLSSYKSSLGLSFYAGESHYNEGKIYIYNAIDELLRQATKVCLVSDLQTLTSFLDENLISPVDNVCGTMSLFSYYLSYRSYDEALASQIMTKYMVQSRPDYPAVGQVLLSIAFTSKLENLWKKMSDLYKFSDLEFYGRGFERTVMSSSLESVLQSYLFIQKITDSDLLKNIKFYVRAKIQMTNVGQDEYLTGLISEAGFDSPAEEGAEMPFKDRDCSLPRQDIIFPRGNSNEDPPPPMGANVYEREKNDLRLCH